MKYILRYLQIIFSPSSKQKCNKYPSKRQCINGKHNTQAVLQMHEHLGRCWAVTLGVRWFALGHSPSLPWSLHEGRWDGLRYVCTALVRKLWVTGKWQKLSSNGFKLKHLTKVKKIKQNFTKKSEKVVAPVVAGSRGSVQSRILLFLSPCPTSSWLSASFSSWLSMYGNDGNLEFALTKKSKSLSHLLPLL